jgi:hypothetical protein
MMPAPNPGNPPAEPGHPAPHRHRVTRLTLALALFLAPAAWLLQLSLSYAVAARACYPHATPLQQPSWSGLRWLLAGFSLAAIALSVWAIAIAFRLWQRTREEHHGSANMLIDVGQGRTRFLAMCAMMASTGFLVALLFTGATLFGVPPCAG